MNSITAFMNSMRLANNGYIPLAYLDEAGRRLAEKARARGLVVMNDKAVFLPAAAAAFTVPAKPTAPVDSFDYEGAILARQERYLFSA